MTCELQIKSLPKCPGVPCSYANWADYGRRAGRASFRWAAWCRDCDSPSLVGREETRWRVLCQLWGQLTDAGDKRDFFHAPMLLSRSPQWLMWGKRSISFHLQLRPLIPPSAGGREGKQLHSVSSAKGLSVPDWRSPGAFVLLWLRLKLCRHACSQTLLHKSRIAVCVVQPDKFFFFFLHNSMLHYSAQAIYSYWSSGAQSLWDHITLQLTFTPEIPMTTASEFPPVINMTELDFTCQRETEWARGGKKRLLFFSLWMTFVCFFTRHTFVEQFHLHNKQLWRRFCSSHIH